MGSRQDREAILTSWTLSNQVTGERSLHHGPKKGTAWRFGEGRKERWTHRPACDSPGTPTCQKEIPGVRIGKKLVRDQLGRQESGKRLINRRGYLRKAELRNKR